MLPKPAEASWLREFLLEVGSSADGARRLELLMCEGINTGRERVDLARLRNRPSSCSHSRRCLYRR